MMTSQASFPRVQRFEIFGETAIMGTKRTTITVDRPTILQPTREDFVSTSGVGEIRIGAQPQAQPNPAGVTDLFPPAWMNGEIWLPCAGTWDIHTASVAEDRVSQIPFSIPYLGIGDPSPETLQVVLHGRSAGRAAYHAEVTDVWDQIMKLEQRMTVREDIKLSARGGDVRFRWGGPPGNASGTVPDGEAFDLMPHGQLPYDLGPAPLASLWARADVPGQPKTVINLVSQKLR